MKTDLSKKLKFLVTEILSEDKMDNSKLSKIIKEANICEDDILQYSRFDHPKHESYGRCEVYKSEHFGVYVMSWTKGDFTAIHNHGHSEWGAVYFLGDAEHRTYFSNKNELKLMSSEIIKKGSIAAVCGDLVHAMGNFSEKPFVTLHIYGSCSYKGTITEDSRVFELNTNRILTTLGPAFLNINENLCKKQEIGIETDEKTLRDFENILNRFNNSNYNVV